MNDSRARGTTPPGARSEPEAARWVRGMFARVARRYDFLNHLLSLNVDRHWRARAVRRLRPILGRPGALVLDICCGTGDLLLALEAERGGAVVGSDFCHAMLIEAQRKIAHRHSRSALVEADALSLPFPDGSLDLVTAAFGFRNLANYEQGLREMRRVLKPGGAAAILEFSQPKNPFFAAVYGFYSGRVLPVIGGLISGDRSAYRYLPESVRRFPPPEELAAVMRAAGFARVEYERMTGGIVSLHVGYQL
ncbi:MAG: bifunctional demethylmenaquinone methyltransferase/2-methoxy-6-polyprenyl-1,4-benzoquinol methylase UbiE [Bryobacteraceae bacterium]